MDIKNKIVELKNGEKYVVADSITYSNRTLLDEELSENLKQIFAMNLEIN